MEILTQLSFVFHLSPSPLRPSWRAVTQECFPTWQRALLLRCLRVGLCHIHMILGAEPALSTQIGTLLKSVINKLTIYFCGNQMIKSLVQFYSGTRTSSCVLDLMRCIPIKGLVQLCKLSWWLIPDHNHPYTPALLDHDKTKPTFNSNFLIVVHLSLACCLSFA